MTYARREIYNPKEVGTYHCISRCVRRAFLCGKDKVTGESFEHRRKWIRNRVIELVDIFAIEVVAYSVMSNHLHSVLRTRPDVAKEWSDEEVAKRWRKLFPLRRIKGKPAKPSKAEISAIVSTKGLVNTYRERLSNLSWFNRCLNENVARRANYEDKCKGRFWEGRFKCQKVEGVGSIVACSAYVDLNPIRAGISKTLEGSDYTSIQQRIKQCGKKKSKRSTVPLVNIKTITDDQLTLKDYLQLVDEAGRIIKDGKGRISEEISPILERLKLSPENWTTTVKHLNRGFKRIVATVEKIQKAAIRSDKCWFHGISFAKEVFG